MFYFQIRDYWNRIELYCCSAPSKEMAVHDFSVNKGLSRQIMMDRSNKQIDIQEEIWRDEMLTIFQGIEIPWGVPIDAEERN